MNENKLIGLFVEDKTSDLHGEIIGVVGPLEDHRTRLLALTKRPKMKNMIQHAPAQELVVRVRAGRSEYDYIVPALNLRPRVSDLRRFGISTKYALKNMRLNPEERATLVNDVVSIIRTLQVIQAPYSSANNQHMFLTSEDIDLSINIRLGNNCIRPYNGKKLVSYLRGCGLYKIHPKYARGEPMRIGIINGISNFSATDYCGQLQSQIQQLGFRIEIIHEEIVTHYARVTLETALDTLDTKNIDIVLAFFSNDWNTGEQSESPYFIFKEMAVGRGIPSQVIYENTTSKSYAKNNIILGILGKTGNIPYVLADALTYTDYVVGIDIARERKQRLEGTMNSTAIARIYFNNGDILRYALRDAPIEGETIPPHIIKALFPRKDFAEKRVVVHRDGFFRGMEKQTLREWGQAIGTTFQFVEVIKSGSPRMYLWDDQKVDRPPKGSMMKLSDTEAFLVSSLPPFKDSTPQPLHIRTDKTFPLKQALHSVLSLTLLHYGSELPPRLPVSIHYSDKIAYLAARGIKPRESEGSIPYWL